MRGWAKAALAAVLLSALGAPATASQVGAEVLIALREHGRARVIVSLREAGARGADLTLHNEEVATVQGAVLSGLRPPGFVLTHQWKSIAAFAGEVTAAGLARIADDPDVLQIDVDPPAYAQLVESAALMRVDQVHAAGVTGRGVVVAVLDTGADTEHPDLRDGILAEQCFCTSPAGAGCCPNGTNQQAGTGSARDDNGHGTNVAGIITSDGRVAPRGIAPDAQVVVIKVLDRTGAGTSASILSGLDFVINGRPEVRIVNLSLGLSNMFATACDNAASFTTAFANAINTLRNRGVLLFASSANSGSSSLIAVPACIQRAIAVGAVYDSNVGTITFGCTDGTTAADRVACFSNSNALVDLLAPGAPVTSAGMGGGQSTFLGTSQACPAAAAAAALVMEARPGVPADVVENALKNTGVTVVDPKNGLSFRRVDAKAAVDSVR